MGNQISQQLQTFLQSILLGLSAGILYDFLRPFRQRLPRATALLDAAYCLTVGGAAFLFLLRRGGGELRGFTVLGAVGGAVLTAEYAKRIGADCYAKDAMATVHFAQQVYPQG